MKNQPSNHVATYPSGKAFNKSSSVEVVERVAQVEKWLRRGITLRSKLKKRIKARFNVEWRQADEYIRRARASLLLHLERSKEEHRSESLAFYDSVIETGQSTMTEKLRSRERIDKLLGLEQPVQIKLEHSIRPNGVPVNDLPLTERKKLLEEVRKRKQEDATDVEEVVEE